MLTPPLLNMEWFRRTVVEPNRALFARIKESGGYIWMHCHGKVAHLLDDLIEIGVDVLNPLEPPKNGDVDMAETVRKYGSRIGLEGNIEIQDLLLSSPEEVRALMKECVDAGAPSGRFILCPSAGYMEYVYPSQHYIDNLMLYLKYGLELVEKAGY
jgi:uroporphyrinogen decarboxylase